MMKSSDLKRVREIINEIAEIDESAPLRRQDVGSVVLTVYDRDQGVLEEIDADDPTTVDVLVDLLAQREAHLPARRATLVADLAAMGVEYVPEEDEEDRGD